MFSRFYKSQSLKIFAALLLAAAFILGASVLTSPTSVVEGAPDGSGLGCMGSGFENGSSCNSGGQCISGFCSGGSGNGCAGTCTAGNLNSCRTGNLPDGSVCGYNSQCQSGECSGGNENSCTSGICTVVTNDPPEEDEGGGTTPLCPSGDYPPEGTLGGPCGGAGGSCGAGLFCLTEGVSMPSACGTGLCMSNNYGGGGTSGQCANLEIPEPPLSMEVTFPAYMVVASTIPPATPNPSANGTGNYHRMRVIPAGQDLHSPVATKELGVTTKPRNPTISPPQSPNVISLTMSGGEEIDYVSPVKVGVQNCNDCTGWCGEWIEMDNLTPHAAPACIGVQPPNAVMCEGDNTGLENDTNYSLGLTCSSPEGSAPKCQMVCDGANGYEYNEETGLCESTLLNVFGWAWSSNIGWIKMNHCNDGSLFTPAVPPNGVADAGSCTTPKYGVRIVKADGTPGAGGPGKMKGYAWSNNLGWVKFGGLSGWPVGSPGAANQNAELLGSPDTNKFVGWFRSILGGLTPEFEGWASLSGTNYPSPVGSGISGVTYRPDLGRIVGHAWGGNVLGWIKFLYVTYGVAQDPFSYKLVPDDGIDDEPDVEVNMFSTDLEEDAVTVSRVLLTGNPEDVEISWEAVPGFSHQKLTLDILNPIATPEPNCIFSMPSCSSLIKVQNDGAPPGVYKFEITGISNTTLQEESGPTIQVNLGGDGETNVSCEAQGNPPYYANTPIVWEASPIGQPPPVQDYIWEGTNVDTSECGNGNTCTTSYSTVGKKQMTVKLNAGGVPAICTPDFITVIINPNFKEI